MIVAKKNAAYYLSFPAIDSTTPESYKTGVSPVDTAYYKDGAGAWTSLAITDIASEIGSTGVYEIDLSSSELDHDKVIIKFAVSGMADDAYQFDLRTKLVDDLNDVSTAQVNTECDTALTDYDPPTNTEMIARTLAAASYFDASTDMVTIDSTSVDLIYDESLSGHNVSGSVGKAIRQVKEGTVSVESTINDGSATSTVFITALTEVTSSHYKDVSLVFIDGALVGQSRPVLSYDGTTKAITLDEALTEAPANGDGFIIKTDHVHTISEIQSGLATSSALATAQSDLDIITGADGVNLLSATQTSIDAIETDTNELQTDWTNSGRLDLLIDQIISDIAGLNDISSAQVNTEVVDVLKTDTIAEIAQGTPTATPTFEEALMYVYMGLRNKIDITASTKEFHNNAGTVIWKKALTDDGAIYSEAEGITGP